MKATVEDTVEWFDDIEQGSPEWHELRRGIVTCSNLDLVMSVGRDGETDSKVRAKLLRMMAGELLSLEPMETFSNAAMERGKRMEPKMLAQYALGRSEEVRRVGFVKRTCRDRLFGDLVIGGSPDALVGGEGGVEIKTMQPDLIVQLVESGRFPSEHAMQVHGYLWATGRRWWDLRICYGDMPIRPTWRIERDEKQIAVIKDGVRDFYHSLNKLVASVNKKAERFA